MKPTLIILISCLCYFKVAAQDCPVNIDFEMGDFTNWQCFTGTTSADYANNVNVIDLKPSPPTPNRHEIIKANNDGSIPLDPYGGFPQLCPYGGKYSVKLGNNDINAQAEGISCTFIVPNTVDTFTITYFYAVVFEDPQHSPIEQPRFFVTAYETATGNLINCASYNYVATGSIPGFKQSSQSNDVLYKEWSPVSIQFAGLANKQVTLEFKTADCTLGGHFGYAYLDVGSGCQNILATAPYCVETNSLQLDAPYGFQYYTWYNEDFSKVIGTTQNITLSPPPVTQGKFWVDMQPYPGYGCRDTVYALVQPYPVPDTPVAKSDYFYCQNQNAQALQATASINCSLLWYTDTTKPASNDAIIPSTKTPGIFYYYVSQKILFGCESRKKLITVHVEAVPVVSMSLNTNKACQYITEVVGRSTSTNLSTPDYEWDFGDGFISKGADTAAHVYTTSGVYQLTLTVTNGQACTRSNNKTITVASKPVANFSYPQLICQNQTQVVLQDLSTAQLSIVNQWQWLIGDKTDTQQNPSFVPGAGGDLPVTLTVSSDAGCVSDPVSKTIRVRYQPLASFIYDPPLCNNKTIHFTNTSLLPPDATGESIDTWQWQFDNNTVTTKDVAYHYDAGDHPTKLTVTSNYGCASIIADSLITVFPKPIIAVSINDSCVYRKIIYTADNISNDVTNWYWDFGKGFKEGKSSVEKYFSKEGDNSFTLMAQTEHSCYDTIRRPFKIYDNKAFAGRDTLVAANQPVQLNANGGTDNHYTWSPALGLNDPTLENPVATYDKEIYYRLDAITNEGCDAHSVIFIKRYKGPEIYIPTAFTPNQDGLNDVLKAIPVGMKGLGYFAVYDKFGHQLFYTTDFTKGWDGKIKGQVADSGTYVAVVTATDYMGNPIMRKTTVVLIK